MNPSKQNISLWNIFLVMSKIGAFTIGGGYAMVGVIQDEITRKGWIGEDEFPDLVALAQTAPGLLAVNMSIYTGYRIRGIPGAVVATAGSCLMPFLTILLIAACFSNFADNPIARRIFAGMRPAVVALIAVPMIRMARKSCRRWWQWILAVSVLLLVGIFRVSPIYIILAVTAGSILLSIKGNNRTGGCRK